MAAMGVIYNLRYMIYDFSRRLGAWLIYAAARQIINHQS